MGLASSLTTALTGMNAAETQIDVLGNNLANAQTVGFKASEVVFATQFLQTLSLGSAPTEHNGGTNPRQVGLGVQVVGITPNLKTGTIELSTSPSDLAIRGDGYFQVEGSQGERLYTRNGMFKLNGQNELVTSTGERLLGYAVDEDYNLISTELSKLQIPLGSESVARATTEVTMQGNLSALGDIADTSKIVQSSKLGTAVFPVPEATGIVVDNAGAPTINAVAVGFTQGAGGTHQGGDAYQYRFTYVDSNGTESMASAPLTVNVPGGGADNSILLTDLPPANTMYSQLRIYRTSPGGSDYTMIGSAAAGGTFTDVDPAASGTPLENDGISGNYTYMVTYHLSGEPETRPSQLLGPQTVVNGRVHLSNFPTPPVSPDGSIPAYDEIRIYRNLSNAPNSFYLVDSVPVGGEYTDSKTDAEISNLSVPGNKAIDMDGPGIDSSTRLVDIVTRDGFDYSNPFTPGELTFQPRKGDRQLEARTFQVTNTSTLHDLMSFMKDTLGIESTSSDSAHPIVPSKNNIPGETGDIQPDVYITNGAIRFVGNTGIDNGVTIDLTSLSLRESTGAVRPIDLGFGTLQEARGTSAVTEFVAYDSLGLPVSVRVTATLEQRNDNQTVYRWQADSPDNSDGSASIAVGTGLIYFDGNGRLTGFTNNTVAVQRDGFPSTNPLQFDLNFDELSALGRSQISFAAARQDGSQPGVLNSYSIGEDGFIRGIFSNGQTRDLGQIRLARFTNPSGLEQRGQNMFSQGVNSGLPIQGAPSENGIGSIAAGAVELSNTDVGGDLVTLILASTQYRSNARVITASQQLFDELLSIRR